MSNFFVTLWTIACQAPRSMEFSRQEHWSGLPFPPPGDLLDPGIEPTSPAFAGWFCTTEPPEKPNNPIYAFKKYIYQAMALFLNCSVHVFLAPLNNNHKCPFHLSSNLNQSLKWFSPWQKIHLHPSQEERTWGPCASCFPPQFAYWTNSFPLAQLCWLNPCIYPDICFGFLSSLQTPSGCRAFPCTQAHLAGALTFCLTLTGLSMEAELCYLDSLATQGGSAIYHLKPQLHPSLDF